MLMLVFYTLLYIDHSSVIIHNISLGFVAGDFDKSKYYSSVKKRWSDLEQIRTVTGWTKCVAPLCVITLNLINSNSLILETCRKFITTC